MTITVNLLNKFRYLCQFIKLLLSEVFFKLDFLKILTLCNKIINRQEYSAYDNFQRKTFILAFYTKFVIAYV